jgi:hypothetical protein
MIGPAAELIAAAYPIVTGVDNAVTLRSVWKGRGFGRDGWVVEGRRGHGLTLCCVALCLAGRVEWGVRQGHDKVWIA